MTHPELLQIMRMHSLAVQSSVAPDGSPQAAVVGIAVTDRLEIVFDTLENSRKISNLRRSPSVAFVIGGLVDGEEWTVQYEGVADEPSGDELDRLKEIYFVAFPDGRERRAWPGITYVRVRPKWIRHSAFSHGQAKIIEFKF
jgi:hypothetical protein